MTVLLFSMNGMTKGFHDEAGWFDDEAEDDAWPSEALLPLPLLSDRVAPRRHRFKNSCRLLLVLERKKFWLAPIILVMLLLGVLIVVAQGSAVAPFIYTLF